jgi:DnaJ-class molecular chaperone
LHREQCFECEGTGKVTIYPLFEVPCHACKGRGYTLELHISFGMS